MTNEYNEIVMDHFSNPRNVGESAKKDGVGVVTSPVCGDTTHIFLDVEDGIIKDIKFKTFGCAAAIASSSMLTEVAKGMSIEDAKKLTKEEIAEKLGGLPEAKVHCSLLAVDAMLEAIKDYEAKAE